MAKIQEILRESKELAEKASHLSQKLGEFSNNNIPATSSVSDIDPLFFAVTIFILACFVGYYVVWKVTPSLHTPLMSVTNAISGIILIGAMIAVMPQHYTIASILGLIGCFIASINIFGGFVVTHRMLKMFKKR